MFLTFSFLPPSIFPSIFPSIRVFSNESALHIRWPKYWSFSFSISQSCQWTFRNWFPLGWTGWISLQSKGLSRVFSNTRVKTINSSLLSFLYGPTLTSIHEKTIALTTWTFVSKVLSLLFNLLSSLVSEHQGSRIFSTYGFLWIYA